MYNFLLAPLNLNKTSQQNHRFFGYKLYIYFDNCFGKKYSLLIVLYTLPKVVLRNNFLPKNTFTHTLFVRYDEDDVPNK